MCVTFDLLYCSRKKTKTLSVVIKLRGSTLKYFRRRSEEKNGQWPSIRVQKKGKTSGDISGSKVVVTHIIYGFVFLFCFFVFFFINLLTGRAPKQVSNAVSRSSLAGAHIVAPAEGRPLRRWRRCRRRRLRKVNAILVIRFGCCFFFCNFFFFEREEWTIIIIL